MIPFGNQPAPFSLEETLLQYPFNGNPVLQECPVRRTDAEIEKGTPQYWVWDDEEEERICSKKLLELQLKRYSINTGSDMKKIGNG
ncbi:MAG: hypothetical protein R2744_12035 [Bacteroidales bacterium]